MKNNIQIICPAAGPNDEFKSFKDHKILIKFAKKRFIEWAQISRPYDLSKAIFIFKKKDFKRFKIKSRLNKILKNKINFFLLDKETKGSPQTVLKLRKNIDLNKPLIIDLLDQYLDLKNFISFCKKSKADGVVPIFNSLYPDRGYALINKKGYITKISEKDKNPISTNSTACVSYFRKAKFFFDYADKMIDLKLRSSNNKYMISLVYNLMIKNSLKVKSYQCNFISSMGSAKSINAFYENSRMVKY